VPERSARTINVKNDKTKAVVNYPKSANFNSGKLQEYWSDKIRALSERYYDHNKETTARYEQGLTILRQLQSKDTDPTNSKKEAVTIAFTSYLNKIKHQDFLL